MAVAATGLLGGAGAVWGGFPGGALGAVVGLLSSAVFDWSLSRRAAREAWKNLGADVTPRPWSPGDGFAALLRADRGIVDFISRPEYLDRLLSWAKDPTDGPVLLLTGSGGVGKTRLALHVAQILASRGWLCRSVSERQDAVAIDVARAVAGRRRVLLIVDYAETRNGLRELMRAAAAHPSRVKVLLLARAGGEWWDGLKAQDAAAKGLSKIGPIEVGARVETEQDDEAVARAAMSYFATAMKEPEPIVQFSLTGGERPPVLTLHAAGLLAILSASPGEEPVVHVDTAIGEVIKHEARYWIRAAEEAGLPRHVLPVLRRAVAVACMLPAADSDEAATLLDRIPELRGPVPADRYAIARWLHEMYPADASSWLGSLQPDLFAELLVCQELGGSQTFADACLGELAPNQAHRVLTLLTRAARHRPDAIDWIRRALALAVFRIAEPAIQVALQTGSLLGECLADALTQAPADVQPLRRVRDAIPLPTVVLATAAAIAAERVVSLTDDHDLEEMSDASSRAAIRWNALGKHERALRHSLRAVDIDERLAARDLHYQPNYADSLNNLGMLWSALGEHSKALGPTKLAFEIYEGLAASNPEGYEPALANVLNSLGVRWSKLGEPQKALEPTERAVAIYERLAANHPETYEAKLAGSLNNLGVRWSALGRPEKALEPTERGVAIYGRLVAARPDGADYEPELASSLKNLGSRLSEIGRPDDAVDRTGRAVQIYERIALASPDPYELELADALDSLANRLAAVGKADEAAAAQARAANIRSRRARLA